MTFNQRILRGYLVKTMTILNYEEKEIKQFMLKFDEQLENADIRNVLLNYYLFYENSGIQS